MNKIVQAKILKHLLPDWPCFSCVFLVKNTNLQKRQFTAIIFDLEFN